jgi:glycosyltransferase involved in cell wall biosynthesis
VAFVTPSAQDAREFAFLVQIGNFVPPPVTLGVRRQRGTNLRLVYIGWMTRTKGIFELSEAVVGLQGVTLDLYGPVVRQTELAEWQALVERLNGGSSIRYRGMLEDDEVLKKLTDYDALVVASYSESFGMAAAEAMINKVPVISSRTGFLALLSDDCFTAVPPGSVSGIRCVLEDVSARPDVLTRKADVAFRFASSELSEEAAFPRWIAVYQQIARCAWEEPHPGPAEVISVR